METQWNRISRIDLLRGLFLVIVIVDHLGRYPGIYDAFSGRGLLWASAAEGFFLMSGMMVGLVYGRKKIADSFKSIAAKLWIRASKLYLLCVATTMTFTLLAILLAGHHGLKSGGVGSEKFWDALGMAIRLHYTYGWADFLQFYAVFMFLAPLAVWLLRKKMWLVVLAMSVYFWHYSAGNMYFSWQILFFAGTIYGFYMQAIEKRFAGLSKLKQNIVGGSVVAVAAISYVASSALLFGRLFLEGHPGISRAIHTSPDAVQDVNNWVGRYFDKASLPWPRLLVFVVWFVAIYVLCTKFERLASKYLGWLLIPMGRKSLSVYIVHSFVVFGLPLLFAVSSNIALNFSFVSLVILAIWATVTQRARIAKYLFRPEVESSLVRA